MVEKEIEICPICNNSINNKSYIVKEMQMGLRENFEYIECSECGCLFLKNPPKNMQKYYDLNYIPHQTKNKKFIEKILSQVKGYYLGNNKIVTLITDAFYDVEEYTKFWHNLLLNKTITKKSRILDVGCGNAFFLSLLKIGKYENLTGIDLFIDKTNIPKNINIIQSSLEDYNPNEKYDIIMSNHSFEHMDNPLNNLKAFKRLLDVNGLLLLRIPVKSNKIWDKYGVNWYQIDAPRHLFLYTKTALEIILDKSDLKIEDIIFDSKIDQFINSEKYSKDISMRDKEWDDFEFNKKTIIYFEEETKKLNSMMEGDQALFIITHK